MTRSPYRIVLCALAVATAVSLPAAAQEEQWATFLIPVSPSHVTGAGGAQWMTDLFFFIASDEALPLFCFTGSCAPIAPRALVPIVAPLMNRVVPGLFYAPVDRAAELYAELRTRNVTPGSADEDFTVEIPIAREEDFRGDEIQLLAIPLDPSYRQALRVYDVEAHVPAQVRVEFYGGGAEPLAQRVLSLGTTRGTESPYALPDEPSFAEILNLLDEVPELAGLQQVRIRVTPVAAGPRLWAFVSVTNNATQHISVFTPF